jgi:hypothetical protein
MRHHFAVCSFGVDLFRLTAAGTFVHVVEPLAIRWAWAREAGCVLLVLGGKPGTA